MFNVPLEEKINFLKKEYNNSKKKVAQLQKLLEQSKKEAKKCKNPEYLREKKKQIFEAYLQILDLQNKSNKLPADLNARHYMVIGDISAGKSSFINYFFHQKQNIGVGETTSAIKKIPGYTIPNTNKTIYIWDTPGKNEEFNLSNYDMLQLYSSAHKIFILNKKSPEDVKEMVQVLYRIKKDNLYYVRTQVDSDLKGLSEEMLKELYNKDNKLFQELGIFQIKIFQVAVNHHGLNIQLSQYDNQKVHDELYEWKE